MTDALLILNPGSSSWKFSLLAPGLDRPEASEQLLVEGSVERLGEPEATLHLRVPGSPEQRRSVEAPSASAGLELVLDAVTRFSSGIRIEAAACRVVHGGSRFMEATLVTPEVLDEIRALRELAPLHNPVDVAALEAIRQHLPDTPLFAVFDTAFHRTLPDVATTYALPAELSRRYGLRRFGFHGISHRYVSGQLLEALNRPAEGSRLLVFHLGNGASVCAVRDGRSLDTSMGFTPLEGLVMGTRCGDLDPGLVLHLLRTTGMSAEELDALLNRESGLLGISGKSADLRELESSVERGDAASELAMEVFAYRAARYAGSYFVVLGGLDAIAFTGGIGEHSAGMRARICRRLACLGLELDETANQAAGRPARITTAGSVVQAWVIAADEQLQMAREVRSVCSRRSIEKNV